MRNLVFSANGQILEKNPECDFTHIARGSNKYLNLVFLFDREWLGTGKVCSITTPRGNVENIILKSNSCEVPIEVTYDYMFSVQVYGKNKHGQILATNKVTISQI